MKIKYINHACFLIEINKMKIVIDPYVETEEQISAIKEADFALIRTKGMKEFN